MACQLLQSMARQLCWLKVWESPLRTCAIIVGVLPSAVPSLPKIRKMRLWQDPRAFSLPSSVGPSSYHLASLTADS